MNVSLTHPGLPPGVTRFDLFRLFEKVAKSHFRLSRTAIKLIERYIQKTCEADYQKGRICAAWPQVGRMARELQVTTRSINAAERKLEEEGFLVRSTTTNGARNGIRFEGRIGWAAGINLAPLIERFDELQHKAQATDLRHRAIDQCKAEIRQINSAIRKSEQVGPRATAESILPHGRAAHINDLDRLTEIRAALAAVLLTLQGTIGANETSDGPEENFRPNILPKSSPKNCSGATPPPTAELRVTPRIAAALATDGYRDILRINGGVNWPSIVETSWQMALCMGVDQSTWQSACSRLGREHAALCVIIIQRNATLTLGHRYHARKPAHCFLGMVKASAAGTMNLDGLVAAMRDREDIIGSLPRPECDERPTSFSNPIFAQIAARYDRWATPAQS